MQCVHCKGVIEMKPAPFSDAVPAWVCTQCGEAYFESREVKVIQKALSALDRESAALAAQGG